MYISCLQLRQTSEFTGFVPCADDIFGAPAVLCILGEIMTLVLPALNALDAMIGSSSTSEPLIDSDRESNKSDDSDITKEQQMCVWNKKFEKWHECLVTFCPPALIVTEYEDLRLEVNEKQLLHLKQKWFHGNLTRREARSILQDFGGGNGSFLVRTSESYHGKFAISFVHESKVKHVVIESKRDPVAGVLYNITPNGPFFTSLYELIEGAKVAPVIQNHMFDVKLGKFPPKPDQRWLHRGVKSLSQAEQILRKEHRDGAFFVYRTQSDYAPYIVAYRSNGSILHNLIVTTQRPTSGYSLNNVTAPVLYKLIHYFMENPINGSTVLKHPVEDRDPVTSNCGIAVRDVLGVRSKKYLGFTAGSLITNISQKSTEWSTGDHRGDKQMFFQSDSVRLLTKDEMAYISELRSTKGRLECEDPKVKNSYHSVLLNLQNDYAVSFFQEDKSDKNSTIITIEPVNPMIKDSFRKFKLSCPSTEDLEMWYQTLQQANCLPRAIEDKDNAQSYPIQGPGKKSCVIC